MAEFDLATARRDTIAALGAMLLHERPNDLVLDEAMRTALDVVVRRAPLEETAVTAVAASAVIDLGALIADLFEVGGIYGPWMDQGDGRFRSAAFRTLSPGEIMLEGPTHPQVGTVLRVRYRRRYAIRDLDGATATTLPAPFERPVVVGACGALMDTQIARLEQMAPETSSDQVDVLRRIARTYWSRCFEMMSEHGGHVILNWGRVGLD